MQHKSFNTRVASGNSKGALNASTYLANGVHNSPYHSPRASPRASPRSTPASSPRIGSPKPPHDLFYGSPKKQMGVDGGGVRTPVLSSPANRPKPFGPSDVQPGHVQGQVSKQKVMIGGPGGGFGPGSSSSRQKANSPPPPPLPADTQKMAGVSHSSSSGRGTPTGLPGTDSPVVGGSARGTYLALYAESPSRHTEKSKPSTANTQA